MSSYENKPPTILDDGGSILITRARGEWGGCLPLGAWSAPLVVLAAVSSTSRIVWAFQRNFAVFLLTLAFAVAAILGFCTATRVESVVTITRPCVPLRVSISTALEFISVWLSVEEPIECGSRITWCGSPDHLTSSLLLSATSHCLYFTCFLDGKGRRNGISTFITTTVWLLNLCITLNVYNGDVIHALLTPLQENYEYIIGHFIVIVVALFSRDDDLTLWLTATMAIVANLYWVGAYPFTAGAGGERHRTEFYDTHSYIANAYHCVIMMRLFLWQHEYH